MVTEIESVNAAIFGDGLALKVSRTFWGEPSFFGFPLIPALTGV